MKPIDAKLSLVTRDLQKAKVFYSALGITWDGFDDVPIGSSGLPEHVENFPELAGLPHLFGNLGNIEFFFYVDGSIEPVVSDATTVLIYYSDKGSVAHVLKKLESMKLLRVVRRAEDDPTILISDPDGRQIGLCIPHPLAM